MGASRGSLAGLILSEGLVFAVFGAAFGLWLAYVGTSVLRRVAPPSLPRIEEVAIEPRGLLFALGASLLSAVMFGAIPLVRILRSNLAE